jgi:hypothetical protein
VKRCKRRLKELEKYLKGGGVYEEMREASE